MAQPSDPQIALRCRGLVKRYGEVKAVAGLDLDVRRGECFGMLGPNGAGKTTTVEIFEGLRVPDAGEVEVLGEPWSGDGLRLRTRLGIQLQGPLDGTGGLLRVAVTHDQIEVLRLLLDFGLHADERVRVPGVDEVEYSWGFPLWECAATGKHAMAELLLKRGADPNAQVYASGSPVTEAYGHRDSQMIALLERYGGVGDATTAALYRYTDLARSSFSRLDQKREAAEGLLGAAACGGEPDLVQLALGYIDWTRDDPRWFGILEQPLRFWNHGRGHWCHPEWDRGTYLSCFRLILERCDANIRGRGPDRQQFGLTILHSVVGSRDHVTAPERVAFATALLDAGARLDIRDHVLKSTPLGWACLWGRVELVRLFLARGADAVEADAEPWATPGAWARRKGHTAVLELLHEHGG